ncbi:PAS domain S-box protein [Methylomonas sp. SURF-1]|uniref:histidine kinase n=1 Tax=Methylomonas aurea TaxID=2952224 RepID=A0ABT1UJI5_9GAMM|nr:PAS domain S-box protein [Methylomonas sp. SURF-1]MCQ8182393.1 PAS domain S-box protein [Methylomonas sp. SURF-1]
MLQKRLIALLLLLILLPTFATGWMAYRFAIDTMRSNRLDAIGRVAESRREQLAMVLRRADNRADAFMAEVLAKCLADTRLDRDCASRAVNDFLHGEGAAGAWLFLNDKTETLAVGNPPLPLADLAEFRHGQITGLIPSETERPGYFYAIAREPGQPWRLAVFYPIAPIQAVFGSHPDLGRSGENLLADPRGLFVTPARYRAAPDHADPSASRPLQACLAGDNVQGLDKNYRGRPVIYGYRHVAEIGGGCILAQIEQEEALSAIESLEHNMLLVVSVFVVLTGFTSHVLAKRIVGPIARLTFTARRIRDGDLSLRAEVTGHDEIAELASSFNHMTDALADAQHNLEAKIAERTRELRTSEERYILAERAVNDGIWDWNILTHEYYLSPRWNKILGYGDGELPNVESIFFELIHPDDKARASEAFARHLEHNERYTTELRLRHRDGSYRWVLDRGEALRDESGRPVRMVGSITDITERKAAEAELLEYREHLEELVAMATTEVKAIVQTAVNGVVSIDSNGTIHMFNPAAEKLFGWRSEEIVGKNVSLLMPEPDASAHDGYIRRFLEGRQSKILGTEREVIAQRKDGSRFPASLAVGHGIISEGRHIFVGFISDITLQKQAEQELRQAKEAAEAAAKAKANFLANMSHEIRTPMNTVIGFAEVALQDANLSNATRNHIKTILSSGRHLLSVINDILDFSKIEAGKIELESVCFNLPVAIQEALQIMSLRAAEKGLRIDLALEAGLPSHFVGDPNRLRQVILNLVGNSVKFTESGYISVSIGRAEQPEMLHFAIADTGIGMTPEQTGRIFESFSQADATTSRRFGGTGLGTTISKQIVEMMGGRIWVESQLGVGSVFHFTVRLPEAVATDNCLYESAAPRKLAYYSPRRFKILLAEDVEANAKLASLRLEQQGHQVHWVKNGAEAVAAYRDSDFDLILMDLQMPVLDGIQATRQIRELERDRGRRIPILALTASVLNHERRESLAAGIDAIVGKPIDIDELLAQMENLTPAGFGIANNGNAPAIATEVAVDFAPLAEVADYRKGLSNWLDPLIYADALINFAAQHGVDADKIQHHLAGGDSEAARRGAHALKGVAGNLALTEIAALAAAIDAELKNGTPELAAAQIERLRGALDQAAAAIRQLELPEKPAVAGVEAFDAERIGELLQQLLRNLDTLNPEKVEPVLQELAPYLAETELKAIRFELDSFDFDGAKAEARRLQAKLTDAAEGEHP